MLQRNVCTLHWRHYEVCKVLPPKRCSETPVCSSDFCCKHHHIDVVYFINVSCSSHQFSFETNVSLFHQGVSALQRFLVRSVLYVLTRSPLSCSEVSKELIITPNGLRTQQTKHLLQYPAMLSRHRCLRSEFDKWRKKQSKSFKTIKVHVDFCVCFPFFPLLKVPSLRRASSYFKV